MRRRGDNDDQVGEVVERHLLDMLVEQATRPRSGDSRTAWPSPMGGNRLCFTAWKNGLVASVRVGERAGRIIVTRMPPDHTGTVSGAASVRRTFAVRPHASDSASDRPRSPFANHPQRSPDYLGLAEFGEPQMVRRAMESQAAGATSSRVRTAAVRATADDTRISSSEAACLATLSSHPRTCPAVPTPA